jgi:hypothetical protein
LLDKKVPSLRLSVAHGVANGLTIDQPRADLVAGECPHIADGETNERQSNKDYLHQNVSSNWRAKINTPGRWPLMAGIPPVAVSGMERGKARPCTAIDL